MAPSEHKAPEKKAEKTYKVKHGQVLVGGVYRQVGETVKESELAHDQAKQMIADGFLEG